MFVMYEVSDKENTAGTQTVVWDGARMEPTMEQAGA